MPRKLDLSDAEARNFADILAESFSKQELKDMLSRVASDHVSRIKFDERGEREISLDILQRGGRVGFVLAYLEEALHRRPADDDLRAQLKTTLLGALTPVLKDLHMEMSRVVTEAKSADIAKELSIELPPEKDLATLLALIIIEADDHDHGIEDLAEALIARGADPGKLKELRERYLDDRWGATARSFSSPINELGRLYPDRAAGALLLAQVSTELEDAYMHWDSDAGLWHGVVRYLSVNPSWVRALVSAAWEDKQSDSLRRWLDAYRKRGGTSGGATSRGTSPDSAAKGTGLTTSTKTRPSSHLVVQRAQLESTLERLGELVDQALDLYGYVADPPIEVSGSTLAELLDEAADRMVALEENAWRNEADFDQLAAIAQKARNMAADNYRLGKQAFDIAAKSHEKYARALSARAVELGNAGAPDQADDYERIALLVESLVPYWKMKATYCGYMAEKDALTKGDQSPAISEVIQPMSSSIKLSSFKRKTKQTSRNL